MVSTSPGAILRGLAGFRGRSPRFFLPANAARGVAFAGPAVNKLSKSDVLPLSADSSTVTLESDVSAGPTVVGTLSAPNTSSATVAATPDNSSARPSTLELASPASASPSSGWLPFGASPPAKATSTTAIGSAARFQRRGLLVSSGWRCSSSMTTLLRRSEMRPPIPSPAANVGRVKLDVVRNSA